ncbi:MAG: peptide ABC transporter substrate-binding protein, partial [Gammaproteobacteria bacterium]
MILLAGCGDSPWNNPYPGDQSHRNIYYNTFSERPKHLDPVSSYTASEYAFIGQIYEPPFQYHFLKRPYELVPLTATAVPQVEYFDSTGNLLDADAPANQVHRAKYRIT